MKISVMVLLIGVAAGVAAFQNPVSSFEAPGVKVLSSEWRRDVVNPALLEDPNTRGQTRAPAQNPNDPERNKVPVNRLLVPNPANMNTRNRGPRGSRGKYIYEIKVANNGTQTIRSLMWDFDLIEPETGRQVGHHTFTSGKTIRAGQTVKLVERSTLNPMSVVDATSQPTSAHNYPIRVTINRIEYEDGSVWTRPAN